MSDFVSEKNTQCATEAPAAAVHRRERDARQNRGLRVSNLKTAIHHPINLQLPGTGVVGVFGPSGAGKSTLLASLAGLLRGRGEVSWGEEAWQRGYRALPLHRRSLSLGFQDARLFPGLTVAQNLELAARYARRPLEPAGREQLVRALELEALLSRDCDTLSGGEMQRVALARQLLNNAPVQFFDEPISAVDVATRIRRIVPALKRFWREHPALVLWVSHDLAEMQLLADSAVRVVAGRVLQQQSLALSAEDGVCLSRVAQSHLKLCVREYLSGDQLLVLELGQYALYADRCSGDYRRGETVTTLLSAADISISLTRPSGSSLLNCLPVAIRALQPLEDGRVRLLLTCESQVLHAEISKFSSKKLQLQPGRQLFAQFKAGSLQGL